MNPPTRRDLLRWAPAASAVAIGCIDRGGDSPRPPWPNGEDTPADSDDDTTANPLDPADTDIFEPLPVRPGEVTKVPWVSLSGRNAARLRFETQDDVEYPVWVTTPDGTRRYTPTRSKSTLTWSEPSPALGRPPDLPGEAVLHEVVIAGLPAGELIGWSFETPYERFQGTFRTPDRRGGTIAWLADTTFPETEDQVALLAAGSPDLVLHGGDMVYTGNPADTWSGLFRSLQPLTSIAPFHATIGNHENEGVGEREQMFDRLFADQGEPGGATRYCRLTFGPARILVLDSETTPFSTAESAQYEWLDAELDAADADPSVRCVILTFHRPLFTISPHFVRSPLAEQTLLPHLQGHKVKLVMHGHSHCFEHFLLYGVHWVVDGSAGANLYNPDASLASAEQLRPDVLEGRLHAEYAHGACFIDVGADGSLTLRRIQGPNGQATWVYAIP